MKRVAVVAAVFSLACGTKGNSFGDGGDSTDGGDPCADNPLDPNCNQMFDETGGETAPPCENLECQIINCGTQDGTTISGTVYDPAQKNPLYNVFVYVPNRPLDPIADGPVCTQCQAPASGKPIASATTDAKGKFVIKNAPAGQSIPLVMQLGKWRRKILIPNVNQCADNPLTDKTKTRLPKKNAEGGESDNHIPKIAFTTGCDMAQCFLLNKIGIDPSEFTGPTGNGRVHVYGGNGYNSSVYGPPNMGDAYALWGNLTTMKKYDMIFNACECNTYPRDTMGPAYDNMKSYLDQGGRAFVTHYHYNFFANNTECAISGFNDGSCKGPTDFNGVAKWVGDGFGSDTDYLIDTGFPKGKAFADWLDNVNKLNNVMPLPMYGHAALVDTRNNATAVVPPTSKWIYTPSWAYYFSWNTPVKAQVMNQCGRAVFSGVHLSGTYSTTGGWPTFCNTAPFQDHSPNEYALEFLFFDLSSCVQDDSMPPPPPPPK